MSSGKPSIPKGTRDFGPQKMSKRLYLLDTIRRIFQLHGFQPLETPAMENLSVLTGKYGDEGDQLMFKILNTGDFLKEVVVEGKTSKALTPEISEKALRYDLTVPFARFVATHREEIQFPFKRYQIQPVWRADKPQRGRYREFYQCDADIVGADSLLCEQELMEMAHDVMLKLGITQFSININNRKILSGIAEGIGEPGKETIICTAIDKLDKIGQEGVEKELLEKGIATSSISALLPVLHLSGSNEEKIQALSQLLKDSSVGQAGLAELKQVIAYVSVIYPDHFLVFEPSLARGLSYYTGAIFEIKAKGVVMGSISGGGRYDNLTGVFGLDNMSGVGISFGIDRIYDVMEELHLFPENELISTKVLLVVMDETAVPFALQAARELRRVGVQAEIYPDAGAKMKKQLGYANARKIPFAAIIGSEEVNAGVVTLKNLNTGEQQKLAVADLPAFLQD